jgi:predicted proteasome-type protease
MLATFRRQFSQMKDGDRGLVLFVAQKLAKRKAV